ncbi:hypothetical protein PALU110988_02475 [Paenibacillus lupini]|uniref:hypothetical protein n=1 Tax=Paenibacillus lupini TaxID=1450204 RepID=UPI00141FECFA|nr:hypothetical protein [Paenibacillus lupini]NIK20965.1 spore germination protein PD [Paenibacillus lupini]
MLNFTVHNCGLTVGSIEILGVSAASMFQIGDSDYVTLYSMFDTPPESVIAGPIAPLPTPEDEEQAAGEAPMAG